MSRDDLQTCQKILKESLPAFHMLFHPLLSCLLSTQLLFWRRKGFRCSLVVVISEQIYMGSCFEETNFSQRDILTWRPQEEEAILLTFKSALFKKSKFCIFWHLTQLLANESPPFPPMLNLVLRFGIFYGSQWIKATTFFSLTPVCFHGHAWIFAVPGTAGAYKLSSNQLEAPASADVLVKDSAHCSWGRFFLPIWR